MDEATTLLNDCVVVLPPDTSNCIKKIIGLKNEYLLDLLTGINNVKNICLKAYN